MRVQVNAFRRTLRARALRSHGVPQVGTASQQGSRRHLTRMGCDGKFFVGGNWKSNGTKSSVTKLVEELNAGSVPSNTEVVCAPTFVHLPYVSETLDAGKFQVSAQNCWVEGYGAYTGEITAEALGDMSVNWVILGHSERRALNGETNEFVADKCKKALDTGLSVIACIGETLEQRESGKMFEVLDAQLAAIAGKIDDWSSVVVAYEPVWAIGTGVVATPDQAQEVHAYLRKWFADNVSPSVSKSLRVIYGGSVNAENCSDLATKEDVDGFLVGGASLKGPDFLVIANAFEMARA
ncbi:triosephosphate isomerase [Chloropicon primus]|uniref:Triosephosphate isomerase n=1 Tax=Chloropicon primus TaxID=1764295 RepID=A0A5B8MFA6_9CHLO|nr:triosephosphate isomerase [Chloropicon primus]UPQ98051.1 triosephosphate isomerase [Chloropicon primus]|mmetsp:Transcript_7803/g.16061  ORF Transcript_7803/g.16061 Transcript_7803/m.16061 type:complete len:295 (-) Transcript_7803:125-1009(-)|eukprot:QDZ18844.1 triosephosphate isomerase [Chloropicon primus]